jgi:hypothetical protein
MVFARGRGTGGSLAPVVYPTHRERGEKQNCLKLSSLLLILSGLALPTHFERLTR